VYTSILIQAKASSVAQIGSGSPKTVLLP